MRSLTTTLALLLCFGFASQAHAVDDDQPIGIEADFAEFNRDKGVTIYNGKVIITQGTRRFLADKVHIYTNAKDEMEKIIAIGKPAKFKHRETKAKDETHAEADRIEFVAKQHKLLLSRAAKVWKGNDSIVSEHIVYDTNSGKVQTGASKTSTKPAAKRQTPKGRVRMTLQPSSN